MFRPLTGYHQATHIRTQKEAFMELLKHTFPFYRIS